MGQILKKNLVRIVEDTVLNQSSWNKVRILIIIISGSGLNLGHVSLKKMSQGQIIEEPTRAHSFDQKFMKLCQNINPHHI